MADRPPVSARHFHNLAALQLRRELLGVAAKHAGPLGHAANHLTDGGDDLAAVAPADEPADGTLSVDDLKQKALDAIVQVVQQAVLDKAPAIIAQNISPQGAVLSKIYNRVTWFLSVRDRLAQQVDQVAAVINSVRDLATTPNGTTTQALADSIVRLLNGGLPLAITLVAKQLQLDDLPKRGVAYRYDDKTAGQPDLLWVKNLGGPNGLVIMRGVQGRPFGQLDLNADLPKASAPMPGKPGGVPADAARNLARALTALSKAEGTLTQDLMQLQAACFSGAGCFAAGTELWTPDGYRAIETIRPGEAVWSRDEHDRVGQVEAKEVEDVFVRYAGVYELGVAGRVLRASGGVPVLCAGAGVDGGRRAGGRGPAAGV